MTTRDATDFKNWLRRDQGQAVATVNRALVTLRRYLGWLADKGHVPANPVKPVKELRKVALAPKGLDRSAVRRLLREIELRQDLRAGAVFSLSSSTPSAECPTWRGWSWATFFLKRGAVRRCFEMGRATRNGWCRCPHGRRCRRIWR